MILTGKRQSKLKIMSNSCDKLTSSLQIDMLSSISKKLKANNIEVLSKKKSSILSDNNNYIDQINISCLPTLQPIHDMIRSNRNYVEYSYLATYNSTKQALGI
jgi:hypothetical protein